MQELWVHVYLKDLSLFEVHGCNRKLNNVKNWKNEWFTHLLWLFQKWMFKKSSIHLHCTWKSWALFRKKRGQEIRISIQEKIRWTGNGTMWSPTSTWAGKDPRLLHCCPLVGVAEYAEQRSLRRVRGVPGPELTGGHNLFKKSSE